MCSWYDKIVLEKLYEISGYRKNVSFLERIKANEVG